jgi:hypothetical protein
MFRALAGALLSAPIVLDKEATPPARAIRTSGSMRGVWKRKPWSSHKSTAGRKGRQSDMLDLQPPRHTSTLPIRDVASNVSNAQMVVVPLRLPLMP